MVEARAGGGQKRSAGGMAWRRAHRWRASVGGSILQESFRPSAAASCTICRGRRLSCLGKTGRPQRVAPDLTPAAGSTARGRAAMRPHERTDGAPVFQVKICGVTTPADARSAAAAGADAIGLNFVAGSPRFLGDEAARAVAAAVPRGVLRVGVFAGASAEEILRVAEGIGLDAIQLHGLLDADPPGEDRPAGPGLWDAPVLCRRLSGLPVIRAVRLDSSGGGTGDGLAAARRWIAAAAAFGAGPAMALVDAGVSRATGAGQLGGTGATVDWQGLATTPRLPLPTALAGGL
ncbi:MAG: hypothetical protein EBZ59_09845, partial [Planctomycetia bacterium]|nr:hypothetical protein [Planctomycetia bacterium]